MPTEPPSRIVVVGASAGGVEALRELVSGLPTDLDAAVLVVLHMPSNAPSALARLLDRVTDLEVRPAEDADPLEAGVVHVAKPDLHLMVADDHVRLVRGPLENGHRPAIDPLFRSAARQHGNRVVACVLSGSLEDGSAGAAEVEERGGVVLVQDPDEAAYPDMPRNAMESCTAPRVHPLAELADVIAELVAAPPSPDGGSVVRVVEDDDAVDPLLAPRTDIGSADAWSSTFTCPDCDGPMVEETVPSSVSRFRCRVGHAWTLESLVSTQGEAVEIALWNAVRVLEEQATLAGRLIDRADRRGHDRAAERFRDQARNARDQAAMLRQVITRGASPVDTAAASA